MKTTRIMALAVLAVLAAACQPCLAASIWARADRHGQAPYADDTARNLGDLLTIVIAERSIIDNETNRSLQKKDERTASVATNIDLLRGIDAATGKLFSIPDMDLSSASETKFTGRADFDANRTMTDRITVTVEDVLPNGNLVVLGTRRREVDGDMQTIQVSGIVRPSDIAFDNSVTSSRVAEFHIVYRNGGPEGRFTRPGWLARILNILNPF